MKKSEEILSNIDKMMLSAPSLNTVRLSSADFDVVSDSKRVRKSTVHKDVLHYRGVQIVPLHYREPAARNSFAQK